MHRILVASDRFEAYLLVDRLARAGIKAHVFNEHMSSIVGDIPPEVALPQVWLDDDAELTRAEAVMRSFRIEQSRDGVHACPGCGEENPATFETCWSCGATIQVP